MALYLVSGKLGSGKSLACVGRIRDALFEGRRVATNLDLRMDCLLPLSAGKPKRSDGKSGWHCPVSVVRLPDKPGVADLELIGLGNESMDERRNGLIVLDELAAWMNARTWADKSRQEVIDWLIHSRKKGWDVIFICQHIDQIDKQIRAALVEYLVVCRRLDRLKIPFVGKLIHMLTSGVVSGNLPQIHVGTVRYGVHPDAPVADRWIYKGTDLYAAYDTRQVFSDRYAAGCYTYLTPWHVAGRYQAAKMDLLQLLGVALQIVAFVPVLPFLYLLDWLRSSSSR